MKIRDVYYGMENWSYLILDGNLELLNVGWMSSSSSFAILSRNVLNFWVRMWAKAIDKILIFDNNKIGTR